jgi:hypothetical protein
MSIKKKSLISALKTTKKANVASAPATEGDAAATKGASLGRRNVSFGVTKGASLGRRNASFAKMV